MFYIGLASFCITLSILLSRQFVQIFYDLQVANRKLSVANKELDIMNNQIKEKNEELKEINYELDKFVNRTSYDLKAPLISVLKIIDAAEEEKDVGKLHTYFLMQKKTLNRISNLVKDIINFSNNKRLQLDLREIDFAELVNQCVGGSCYFIKCRKHQMNTSPACELAVIRAVFVMLPGIAAALTWNLTL